MTAEAVMPWRELGGKRLSTLICVLKDTVWPRPPPPHRHVSGRTPNQSRSSGSSYKAADCTIQRSVVCITMSCSGEPALPPIPGAVHAAGHSAWPSGARALRARWPTTLPSDHQRFEGKLHYAQEQTLQRDTYRHAQACHAALHTSWTLDATPTEMRTAQSTTLDRPWPCAQCT